LKEASVVMATCSGAGDKYDWIGELLLLELWLYLDSLMC
jgi:hypothetical protein